MKKAYTHLCAAEIYLSQIKRAQMVEQTDLSNSLGVGLAPLFADKLADCFVTGQSLSRRGYLPLQLDLQLHLRQFTGQLWKGINTCGQSWGHCFNFHVTENLPDRNDKNKADIVDLC